MSNERVLNKFYPIRTDIPVANLFEIINTVDPEEFHIVLYFINDKKLKLVSRQLDTLAWSQNLQIKLYSNDKSEFEIITIGPSETDTIIKIYETKIKLQSVDLSYEQKIPKKIVQTANTAKMDTLMYNSVMSFIELNPEYEYELYDSDKRRKFIKNHYSEDVLNTYDLLVPGSYKADLFRYCYIYIHGGCYFDFKFILKIPLRNWIEKDKETIFCQGLESNRYAAGMILSVAKDSKIKVTVEECVSRIKNYYSGVQKKENCLWLTGPELLYSMCKEITPMTSVKHLGKESYYILKNSDDSKVIRLFNKSYRNNYIKTYGMDPYPVLWEKEEVIYQDRYLHENIIFFVHPHKQPDKFVFTPKNGFLYIRRIDKDIGWEQNLRIKIIKNIKNVETLLDIGPSNKNVKRIKL